MKISLTEADMSDAFGRRILRDMDRMPKLMRLSYQILFMIEPLWFPVSSFLLLVSCGLMITVISQSYFMFGDVLISENSMFKPMIWTSVVFIITRSVLPGFLNLIVNHWYYSTRNSFRAVN